MITDMSTAGPSRHKRSRHYVARYRGSTSRPTLSRRHPVQQANEIELPLLESGLPADKMFRRGNNYCFLSVLSVFQLFDIIFCRIFCHQKTQRRRSRLPQVILNRKTQPHHPHQDWTNNADNSSRVRKRSSLQLVQETIRPQGFKIPNFQRSHSFCR